MRVRRNGDSELRVHIRTHEIRDSSSCQRVLHTPRLSTILVDPLPPDWEPFGPLTAHGLNDRIVKGLA